MKRQQRKPMRPKIVLQNCAFCETKTDPDYHDPVTLGKYTSERAMILGRDRTGVCSTHQRKLTRAIKRARILGLLPFIVRS